MTVNFLFWRDDCLFCYSVACFREENYFGLLIHLDLLQREVFFSATTLQGQPHVYFLALLQVR